MGQLANTYTGSTTATNSYWTPETTAQESSKLGIRKNISTMLFKSGYTGWNFNDVWKIDDGMSLAYLKNIDKPDAVNKNNLNYIEIPIEGKGTEVEPYIVKTAIQLQKINENLDSYYKLGGNIDLNEVEFSSIGNLTYPFKGTLDGDGYTISNLTLSKDEDNIGLFGYNQGTLKNIKLNNFNISGKNYVASLVSNNTGTINNCVTDNVIINGINYVGGLVRIFIWIN